MFRGEIIGLLMAIYLKSFTYLHGLNKPCSIGALQPTVLGAYSPKLFAHKVVG